MLKIRLKIRTCVYFRTRRLQISLPVQMFPTKLLDLIVNGFYFFSDNVLSIECIHSKVTKIFRNMRLRPTELWQNFHVDSKRNLVAIKQLRSDNNSLQIDPMRAGVFIDIFHFFDIMTPYLIICIATWLLKVPQGHIHDTLLRWILFSISLTAAGSSSWTVACGAKIKAVCLFVCLVN